jgi:hypothetical protein
MKTIYFLLVLAIIGCGNLKTAGSSQTSKVKHTNGYKSLTDFKGDTLKYLTYNLIERKNVYLGKPLSLLINDLDPGVKSSAYSPYWDSNNQQDKVNHVTLYLDESNTVLVKLYKKKKPIAITITIEPAILLKTVEDSDLSKSNWGTKDFAFWGKYIVKDVYVGQVARN